MPAVVNVAAIVIIIILLGLLILDKEGTMAAVPVRVKRREK